MHQTIRFNLRYHTHYGQEVYLLGNIPALGNDVPHQALRLQWENDDWWSATIHITTEGPFVLQYQYILRELEEVTYDGGIREISLDPARETYQFTDTWSHAGQPQHAWQTAPFTRVFFRHPVQEPDSRQATHLFRVQAPLLPAGKTVCLLGSIPQLGNWNIEAPLLLQYDAQNWFTAALQLPAVATTQVRYKYGIYDLEHHTFECYEDGTDRELPVFPAATGGLHVLHDGFARLDYPHWKGAGVSVPVFSLRSQEGFGTGEFADLAPLAQWARQGGLQLIQLLPVNDTISTWTWRDSYPYAAISSFALHPLYIRLQDVGQLPATHPLQRQFHSLRQWLNEKEDVDYETVLTYKMAYLKALYEAEGEKLQTRAYWQWFAANEHWLLPYAVFCYLRDKYHTSDYSRWPEYNTYDYTAINQLVIADSAAANTAHFYFFVQYHLHLQLQSAVEAVHREGIALKGDIPIGISRFGVDAWMNPDGYHLDVQAGAPPDSFTAEGQNWGFPTYNWKKMAADGYDWWQQRLRHMSVYFDAFRIDHILGFFRIWQIPEHAVQGLLGYFHPAIPVSREELLQKGIPFDEERFCKPWITDVMLDQMFGSYAGIIKDRYLYALPNGHYAFQSHCDTQRKIRELQLPEAVESALFSLIAEVLLIKVTKGERVMYHPRYDLAATASFAALDSVAQQRLLALYHHYFYVRQESCWRKEAMHKLPLIRRATHMLICGEDLGMVPHCVPGVMQAQGILGLEVERMPKHSGHDFAAIFEAPYLSVLTPSTHDMSTLRGWWEENAGISRKYYQQVLKHTTPAPAQANAILIKEIIDQHLQANAMWRIFQIQDLLAASGYIPDQHPDKERINIPAVTQHYWRYRINKPITDYELRKF